MLYVLVPYGHGQTIGDRVMKIRVVKTDGGEPSLMDAFSRHVGLIVSFICIFIGVT